jgi:hypothetical protein
MQLKKDEIVVNRKELACLNAFAGRDPKQVQLYGVAFQTQRRRLLAYASDGSKAVRATSKCDAAESQEWLIPRDVVSFAIRTLRGEQDAHFKFTSSGVITKFTIWALDDEGVDKKGEEILLPEPVPAQTLFPFQKVKDALEKVPGAGASAANLPSDAVRAISAVYGAACTELIRLEFPRAEGAPLLVTADGPTCWEASIIRQAAPSVPPEETESPEDDPEVEQQQGPHQSRRPLRLVPTEKPKPKKPTGKKS